MKKYKSIKRILRTTSDKLDRNFGVYVQLYVRNRTEEQLRNYMDGYKNNTDIFRLKQCIIKRIEK